MVFVGKGESSVDEHVINVTASPAPSPAPEVEIKVLLPKEGNHTDTSSNSSHMVSDGPINDRSQNASNESSVALNGEIDVALAGADNSTREGNVTIDEPRHVIIVKSNVTEFEDKDKKGHSIFNESITIVDKPLGAMSKGA